MVVKKKRTYKKQKGGLLILQSIPEKLINYFKFTINIIMSNDTYIKNTSNDEYNTIKMIIEKIKNVCCDNQFNIYILNLSKTLIEILSRYFKDSLYKITIESFVKAILYNLFINETKIFRNLSNNKKNFENNLIAIFINMLFIEYIQRIPNIMIYIKNLLLNFHLEFRDNEYLMYLIKRMFLEQYPICYKGVPVFYGNIIDEKKNLGYNQFICEKVGISSKEKRNYIINPVGAFIYECMNRIAIYNLELKLELKILFSKILRIIFVTGNKINNDFQGLPKLKHLTDTSKFCIKKDAESNCEIIVESSTISKCSKVYGCSLTMTPVIREENIASDEHILELLLILLEAELNKQYYDNLYNFINKYPIPKMNKSQSNPRRHGSALSPIQEFRPKIQEEQITLNKEYDRRYHDKYFELFQEEAYKLINKIKNNKNDIPEIKKLLKIIKDIENKVYPRNHNTEYHKIIIPAIIYYLSEKLKLRLSYLEKNNRARSSGNFSLYNNIKPEQLLKEKDYNTILNKLYKEASILTKNKRRYNSKDIPKINNLLEIINEIGKNRRKMHNFHEDLRQALMNRLNNLS